MAWKVRMSAGHRNRWGAGRLTVDRLNCDVPNEIVLGWLCLIISFNVWTFWSRDGKGRGVMGEDTPDVDVVHI
jgi:hypothetical protein